MGGSNTPKFCLISRLRALESPKLDHRALKHISDRSNINTPISLYKRTRRLKKNSKSNIKSFNEKIIKKEMFWNLKGRNKSIFTLFLIPMKITWRGYSSFEEASRITKFTSVLHMARTYTGRLRPKGVPFSGFRYIKG